VDSIFWFECVNEPIEEGVIEIFRADNILITPIPNGGPVKLLRGSSSFENIVFLYKWFMIKIRIGPVRIVVFPFRISIGGRS